MQLICALLFFTSDIYRNVPEDWRKNQMTFIDVGNPSDSYEILRNGYNYELTASEIAAACGLCGCRIYWTIWYQ